MKVQCLIQEAHAGRGSITFTHNGTFIERREAVILIILSSSLFFLGVKFISRDSVCGSFTFSGCRCEKVYGF